MLESIIWILISGFFIGQIARRLKAPPLVGMVLAGLLLGPQGKDVLSAGTLAAADELRTIAVMVILMKAGLGLDREKLGLQGTVALRLGFLPGACEAVVVAIAAIFLFQFDLLTGLLLGCIIGAESPAVIVPGMLRLKQLGWGVKKGIPDAILTGSALSDVLLLLAFSLLLAFLSQGVQAAVLPGGIAISPLLLLPLQVVGKIVLGILSGAIAARLLVVLLLKRTWAQNIVQEALVAASLMLALVVLAQSFPIFSGYLAVMSTGFFVIEFDAPLARRLRVGFSGLWTAAEIVLFVLLGASIDLSVLEKTFWAGLLLLAAGTLIGRSLGWYLSTLGSHWTAREKLFLLPGNSAKATVQAAIGAVPLAQGISGGETILALSALSILVTAPLGAWAIPTFAPKLLQKGEVDPTKVAVATRPVLLAAVDTSALSTAVLTKAAEFARRYDGEVVVVHITRNIQLDNAQLDDIYQLKKKTTRLLADIRHQFVVSTGDVVEEIVQAQLKYSATEILLGQRTATAKPVEISHIETQRLVSAATKTIRLSGLPVIIITEN